MATTNVRLVGRVAEILNAKELVVTLGFEQGIRPGMRFAVLTDPLEIKDPESGEVLDVLEREKTRVEAVDVRPRIAVCRTYRPRKTPAAVDNPDVFMPPKVHGSAALRKDPAADTTPYAEEYVKVGDRVVSLWEDEA